MQAVCPQAGVQQVFYDAVPSHGRRPLARLSIALQKRRPGMQCSRGMGEGEWKGESISLARIDTGTYAP